MVVCLHTYTKICIRVLSGNPSCTRGHGSMGPWWGSTGVADSMGERRMGACGAHTNHMGKAAVPAADAGAVYGCMQVYVGICSEPQTLNLCIRVLTLKNICQGAMSHATGRAWAAAQESNQHVQVYKCLCVVYVWILQQYQSYQN